MSYSCTVSGIGNENISTISFNVSGTFPTFETIESNGNSFVKIPQFFKKINSTYNGQVTSFTISTEKVDSTYQLYPCFEHRVYNPATNSYSIVDESPYVLIGSYGMTIDNNGIAQSIPISSGTEPTFYPLDDCRDAASACGEGYVQYDWQFNTLLMDLFLVVSQKWDFNRGYAEDYKQEYLGIHNIDYPLFVDGLLTTWSNEGNWGNWYICYDYNYNVTTVDEMSSAYIKLPYAVDNFVLHDATSTSPEYSFIVAKGYDSNHPFATFPKTADTTSDSRYRHSYYCDLCQTNYWGTSGRSGGGPVYQYIFNNNSSNPDSKNGLNSLHAMHKEYASHGRVGRLCYRPGTVIENITLDLSTIGLPAGTHSIQMSLSDNCVTYGDSELSEPVQYTVAQA